MSAPELRPTLSRRRLLLSTAAGLVAAGVSSLSGPAIRSARAAVETKRVIIGVGPDWGTGGHAVVALKKGYLAEEGLSEVELKQFPAGLVQLEALAAGGIDVGNPAQAPIFTLRAAGIPIIVLASLASYGDSFGLAVRKSTNVKKPADLEGLKIGVLKGTSAELMLDNVMRHYGVDASKVTTIQLKPPEQLSSLATGAIDGICVWQPWVYQASQKVPIDVLHTGLTSHFPQNDGEHVKVDYTRGVLTTTERFARQNPETVAALVRAYAKAQAFATAPENFGETVEIFSDYFNQNADENRIILAQYRSSIALDADYQEDMDVIEKFLADTGRLRKDVDLAAMTYPAPLKAIDPGLVTVPASWAP